MRKTLILVVEDEVIVAENIRSKLEKLGYLVPETVSSGEQAIECLQELQVDLVLMDIELAGDMDGIETAEYIQNQYNLPIIYLTAYADEETLHRARTTEPFSYLLKPFQTRELRSNIEMALYKHRMERSLQESEERYRRISGAITDYIYTVQIQDGEVVNTHHNAACVAVTGYTEEEFRQNSDLWRQVVHPEDLHVVREQAELALRGQNLPPLEHRIIRKNGSVRWVRNTPVLHFDGQGALIAYDGLIQDISERKKSEIALEKERASLAQRVEERTFELKRANAELARAARMKDEFLATMSHEFRTPLHTILGMAEALQGGNFWRANAKTTWCLIEYPGEWTSLTVFD
jgi:PAS domain S-box-containing protein